MCSQNWNCAASFPIPTFMHLWAIYIVPGSVYSKIGRFILGLYKSLTVTWMWKLGDRAFYFWFGNDETAQFYFWEYIKRNQTFILDSHRPFICSVFLYQKPKSQRASFSGGDYQELAWFWLKKIYDRKRGEMSFRVIATKSTFLNPFLTEKISSQYFLYFT